MGKQIQLIAQFVLLCGFVVCGAAGGYFSLRSEPIAKPFLIAMGVTAILVIACSSKWGWLVALFGCGVAALKSIAEAHIHDDNPVVSNLAVALPGVLVVAIVGFIVYVQFKFRAENKAARLLDAGRTSQAVTYLQEQLAAKGLTVGGWNLLSLAYSKLEKWPEALTAVDEAIARFGPNPVLLNNKGIYLMKSGQPAAALPLVEEAARRHPNNWGMACNLGFVLADLGRRSQAETQLQRAERLAASRVSVEEHQITIVTNRRLREEELQRLRDKIAMLSDETLSD